MATTLDRRDLLLVAQTLRAAAYTLTPTPIDTALISFARLYAAVVAAAADSEPEYQARMDMDAYEAAESLLGGLCRHIYDTPAHDPGPVRDRLTHWVDSRLPSDVRDAILSFAAAVEADAAAAA
jgi:hypothetical protein